MEHSSSRSKVRYYDAFTYTGNEPVLKGAVLNVCVCLCAVDSLMLNAGERWDVVVHADQPVGKYWVRMRALGDCGENKARVSQQAILAYRGSNAAQPPGMQPDYESSKRKGKVRDLQCVYDS